MATPVVGGVVIYYHHHRRRRRAEVGHDDDDGAASSSDALGVALAAAARCCLLPLCQQAIQRDVLRVVVLTTTHRSKTDCTIRQENEQERRGYTRGGAHSVTFHSFAQECRPIVIEVPVDLLVEEVEQMCGILNLHETQIQRPANRFQVLLVHIHQPTAITTACATTRRNKISDRREPRRIGVPMENGLEMSNRSTLL